MLLHKWWMCKYIIDYKETEYINFCSDDMSRFTTCFCCPQGTKNLKTKICQFRFKMTKCIYFCWFMDCCSSCSKQWKLLYCFYSYIILMKNSNISFWSWKCNLVHILSALIKFICCHVRSSQVSECLKRWFRGWHVSLKLSILTESTCPARTSPYLRLLKNSSTLWTAW